MPNLPKSCSGTPQLFSGQNQPLPRWHSASAPLLLPEQGWSAQGCRGWRVLPRHSDKGRHTVTVPVLASAQQQNTTKPQLEKCSRNSRSGKDSRRVMLSCSTWQPRTATCIDPAPPQKSPSPSTQYSSKAKAFKEARQESWVEDRHHRQCKRNQDRTFARGQCTPNQVSRVELQCINIFEHNTCSNG